MRSFYFLYDSYICCRFLFHKQELCGFELRLSVVCYCYLSVRPTVIAVDILTRPLALCSMYRITRLHIAVTQNITIYWHMSLCLL